MAGLPEDALPLKQDARTKLIAPAKYGDVRLMSYGYIAKVTLDFSSRWTVPLSAVNTAVARALSLSAKGTAVAILFDH
jgi:hypothetical protein